MSRVPCPAVSRDRGLAPAAEGGEQASLGGYPQRALGIVERRQRGAGSPVVPPHLKPQGSLPGRRHHLERVEPGGDLCRQLKALEPGAREQGGVEPLLSFSHLLDPGRHVAA